MAKKPMSDELRALHKKLMPANIVICLMSIVVIICLLVMPWLDMRIEIHGDKMVDFINKQVESSSGEGEGSDEAADAATDAIISALGEVDLKLAVNIYPAKMYAAANGGEDEMAEFFNSLVGKNGAAEFVGELAEDLAPAMFKAVSEVAIQEIMSEENLSQQEKEEMEAYLKEANTIIDTLMGSDSNPAKAKLQFSQLVDEIIAEQGGTAEDKAELVNTFNKIVDAGVNPDTGKFEITYVLENIDELEKVLSDSTGEDVSIDTESESEIQEMLDMIKNPGSLIVDALGDEMETLKTGLLAAWWVVVGFPLILWGMLALFSFFRIFMKKKTVKMWYVKFFMFWAALILIAANVAPAIIASAIGGEVADIMAMISIKFLGSGVVMGICYGVLVLGGWFYYGRVKRQIKRQKKAEKRAEREAAYSYGNNYNM